jgi:putative DNA methylase
VVPLLPTLVVSVGYKVVAELVPDKAAKRYDIRIRANVSASELANAKRGTVRADEPGQDSYLQHTVDGRDYKTKLSTLRGDFQKEDGSNSNRLRLWEKQDFKPRPDDIFQERLFCIQWMRRKQKRQGYDFEFRSITSEDMKREQIVEDFIARHLAEWQEMGWVPDMRIEPGDETERLYRERGWSYWHHLWNPRHLLCLGLMKQHIATRHSQCFSVVFSTFQAN